MWRGNVYRPGDELVAPDAESGGDWKVRVIGVGDDGKVYVEKLEKVATHER